MFSEPGTDHFFKIRFFLAMPLKKSALTPAQGWEPADKPGSVVGNHSSGTAVTGGLVRPTRKRRGPRHCFPIWSCSKWGLPSHRVLPPARCALTAPFHPYRSESFKPDRRYIFCCTFRRLAPPRDYLAPCPMEPGLSSPSDDGAIAWPTPGHIVSYCCNIPCASPDFLFLFHQCIEFTA